MITCNVCGHINDSSRATCEECGSDLSDSPDWGNNFDEEDFDLYDLYYLLLKPVKVGFTFNDDEYSVEALEENGEVVIKFGNKWYRTVDDFFAKAQIDGNLLTTIYEELHDFTVG